MQGIRFYLEHDSNADKRKGKHNGNVVAADTDTFVGSGGSILRECFSAAFFGPNSQVVSSSVRPEYLAHYCKRISEKVAREIHPRLFERLDEDNEREVKA